MSDADLQNPIFTDETAAREALESFVWPDGPVCPHCGNVDQAKIAKAQGAAVRPGLYYCTACNGQFTATVGTVFEHSKVPLTKWWMAMHLMGSSKKGVSSHQIHRSLGVTYKTAWFMMHRIREAMRANGLAPMGGEGSIVEIDETFIGNESARKASRKPARATATKTPSCRLSNVAVRFAASAWTARSARILSPSSKRTSPKKPTS